MSDFVKAVSTSLCTPLTFSQSLDLHRSKSAFIRSNPNYKNPSLHQLRKKEFGRLDKQHAIYLDYTGANLYPESLVQHHNEWLKTSVAGNPHSTSPSALCANACVQSARDATFKFFDADPEIYDVVWTINASGGLKIVGENYDFVGKTFLCPRDAHNSLNSIALKAQKGGGQFKFIELDPETNATDYQAASQLLDETDDKSKPGLVFFTGQSNLTGSKVDWDVVTKAKKLGWDVGLDAAALAPTTRISLRTHPEVDFMVVSAYKIMGYPTGVGALLIKKEQYSNMKRDTFFGGNIIGITLNNFDFTLVNGPERFEDGTINFLSLVSIPRGFEFVDKWMPKYTQRISILMKYVVEELEKIRYPVDQSKTGSMSALESLPKESTVTPLSERSLGMLEKGYPESQADTSSSSTTTGTGRRLVRIGGPKDLSVRGPTLPLTFFSREVSECGEERHLNFRFIIWAAGKENISLRGSPRMCNPGAAASIMNRPLDTDLSLAAQVTTSDVGFVRVSLGMATNFKDCWSFLKFCNKLVDQSYVDTMWNEYRKSHKDAVFATGVNEFLASRS